MSGTSNLESFDPEVCEGCSFKTSGPKVPEEGRSKTMTQSIVHELKLQMRIGLPLVAMNFLWFGKLTTTSVFLGHQGKVNLAGGSLGFSFANVTGFAVLYGISATMEPICGQAFGAKNFKLLHKTLLMAVLLLLLISIPISLLWLNVHKILIAFGLKEEISFIAKRYLIYLLPDLPVLSLLCPLKAYLSSQGVTLPIMYTTAAATSLHIPINIFLSRAKGIEGVAMAVWITDLIVVILLTGYVLVSEGLKENKWKEAGRLPNPVESVSALIIVFNFEYLLYAVMLYLGTCVATRVSNELGANNPKGAYRAAYTTLAVSVVSGCIGGIVMIACRGVWVYAHHDVMIINSVKKLVLIMAVIEVICFPLFVCGEIVRGTAKPSLGMYANLGGFYLCPWG
ncbi:PREDICTED: MATE efflux family protein 9-like [Brassica oleracea var. oleracea]|uniref:Protein DETOXIFICATION n=1 Tax=Brassica oleracea var. oleracea TaxID=109376 RepID=A0A0D3A5B0_BRAOL|nr:PREDICTED: MATE efflux family protein 9-like [Brassica oleracea var. oleracea]